MTIDSYLDRVPGPNYNCFDFVREVWAGVLGEDITERLTRLTGAFTGRKVTPSGLKGFQKLQKPVSPCFVVMQRSRFVPHIGIYLEDKILHMTSRGVQWMPLVVAKGYFIEIGYYR